MPPLVSICIPCHNAASFVSEALDSALAQTYPQIEVIVVNDDSTDGSELILEEYSKRGVKIVHERCGSAAKARNRALSDAKGDYIKFFDADDILSDDHILLQMERLAQRTDAVAMSEWGRFYSNDLSSFVPNPQSVWRDMTATDWLVESLRDARPMMQAGMFLIPLQILEKSGGWDEELTLIDDFEFFCRVLCHSEDVLFASGATLYYRSGITGSLSGRKNRTAVESAYHSLLRGTRHLLDKRNEPAARLSCANTLMDFVFTYYPDHRDLRSDLIKRISDLGGSDLEPDGSPKFQLLRSLIGWKIARYFERIVRGRSVG